METIRNLYRIGHGPSASHTIGPTNAAQRFIENNPNAASYKVMLYGSLASTGRGHRTDAALIKTFDKRRLTIEWHPEIIQPRHTNAMNFEAYDHNDKLTAEWMAYSVGGGAIVDDSGLSETNHIYPHENMADILDHCNRRGITLWQYVVEVEGDDILNYLSHIWKVMKDAIKRGLEAEGVIPGGLNLQRKANSYMRKAQQYRGIFRARSSLYAYALAVSEENASGGIIVAAPTCGSCGVVPAVMMYAKTAYGHKDKDVVKALATAGLIGTLIKRNASISGAEVGCQGEIGTACAMASGALTQLFGGSNNQIEYSAEMGIEHHLGLTCDPIGGLVQIPCIERNALAAARALSHNNFSMLSDGRHMVSFDKVVKTMKQTGKDLPSLYKETAAGGLALFGAHLHIDEP